MIAKLTNPYYTVNKNLIMRDIFGAEKCWNNFFTDFK